MGGQKSVKQLYQISQSKISAPVCKIENRQRASLLLRGDGQWDIEGPPLFDKFPLRPQTLRQLPRIIPEKIIHSLLQSAYDFYCPTKKTILRDIIVLELLFSTGIRVSELCDLSNSIFQLLIDGKGRKERILQITNLELLRIIKKYRQAY